MGGALVLWALLGSQVAAGCNGTVSEQVQQRNQRLADQVAAELRQVGDYSSVEVVYVDDTTNSRELTASIRCASCAPDAALEAALRATWQSRITPVRTIVVDATSLDPPGTGEETAREYRYVYLTKPKQVRQMVDRFGERPVESNPEIG